MRKLKKLLAAVVTASMVSSFSLLNVLAAEDYTYTITFYAGNQGSFTNFDGLSVKGKGNAQVSMGSDKISITGLTQGDEVTFDVNQ